MRVLFVIDSLECGGAEKSLVSLLSSLVEDGGLHIDVMIMKRGGYLEETVAQKVNLCAIQKTDRKVFIQLRFSVMLRINKLIGKQHGAEIHWRYMRSQYPAPNELYDVAIAYHQGFPTYYVSEKVKARRKIAWINVDMLRVGYSPRLNSDYYDRYDNVVVVSESLKDVLKQHGYLNKEPYVIYDILQSDIIRKMSLTVPYEKKPDRTLLVTVGRLENVKNYPLAVESAKVLRNHGIAYEWLFIGEGSERSKIQRMIDSYDLNNNVKLLGMKRNPYTYMKAADIYVQTSRCEGYGLTIAEAKILHKPIVATDFTVVTDQIETGINGLICNQEPNSVADKIISLIQNPSLRNQLIQGTMADENITYQTEMQKIRTLLYT